MDDLQLKRECTPTDRGSMIRGMACAAGSLLLLVACETAGPEAQPAGRRSEMQVAREPARETAPASSPDAEWALELSGTLDSNRSYVRPLGDGGALVAAGHAGSEPRTVAGPLVTRLNAQGEVVWTRIYAHTMRHELRSIEVAPDGGFFLSGEVGVRGDQGPDSLGWILKADRDGETVFQKTIRTEAYFSLTGTLSLADGGVLAVGQQWINNNRSIRFLRLDSQGRLVWQKHSLRSGRIVSVLQLRQTAAHGVVCCGQTGNNSLIMRLADDGSVISSHELKGGWYNAAMDVSESPDGGLLVAAQREEPRTKEIQPWVVKLDRNLKIEWQKAYGGLGDVDISEMTTGADGSIWVAGSLRAAGVEGSPVVALVLDEDGRLRDLRYFTPKRTGLTDRPLSGERRFISESDQGRQKPRQHVSAKSATEGGCWVAARGREDRAEPMWLLKLDSPGAEAGLAGSDKAAVVGEQTKARLVRCDLEFEAGDAGLGTAGLRPQPTTLTVRRVELPTGAVPERSGAPPATALQDSQRELRARVVRHVLAGELDQLDRLAHELASTRARFSSGWWKLASFYHALDPRNVEYGELGVDGVIELLRAWLQERPDSICARIALAQAYLGKAWTERGSGYAWSVTERGWEDFGRWVRDARDLLEGIRAAGPSDPQLYAALVEATTLLGASLAEVDEVFEQGVAVEPGYDPLYAKRAMYLTERWGGGPEQFSRFAEDAAERTRHELGESMYGRMAIVAFQVEGHEMYSKTGLEWPRVRRGTEDLYGRFPDPRNLHYLLMFACLAEDRDLARELFSRGEASWSEDAAEIWKSRERFEKYRTWALREMAPSRLDPRADELPNLLVRITGRDPVFPDGDGRLGFLVHDDARRLLAITVSGLAERADALHISRHVLGRDVWVGGWNVASATSATRPAQILRVTGPMPPRSSVLPLQGLGLVLAEPTPESPAQPLEMATTPYENERLYIITCAAAADGCRQVVVPVHDAFANRRPGDLFFKLSLTVDGDGLAKVVPGAAVVDERGFAVAVVVSKDEPLPGRRGTVVCEEIALLTGLDPGLPQQLGYTVFQDMVARLFLDRRYSEIDGLGRLALEQDRRLEGNRSEMAALVEVLGRRSMTKLKKPGDTGYLEMLEQWITEQPDSTLAPLVLARFLAELPTCPIGPTFEGPPRTRAEIFERKRACFDRGMQIMGQAPPSIKLNPEYYLIQMQWEEARRGPEDTYVDLYLKGVEVAPLYPRLHEKAAGHLAWLDRNTQGRRVAEVAEQAALHAPPKLADAIYALVVIEAVCPAGDALLQQYGLDWGRVRDGEEILIARNLQREDLEEAALRLVCLMGDRATARSWFERLAPEWAALGRQGCWNEQAYLDCQTWATE